MLANAMAKCSRPTYRKTVFEKNYMIFYVTVCNKFNAHALSTFLEIRVLQGVFTNTYNKPYPI
jgi:hypothetical protein